jgi:hypothetical protein
MSGLRGKIPPIRQDYVPTCRFAKEESAENRDLLRVWCIPGRFSCPADCKPGANSVHGFGIFGLFTAMPCAYSDRLA